ncbi:hypothetical protein AB0L26_27940 [Streptomyces nondiastaticus]|uniref:hypothetical protein n=1 Tax=Streptomyces nondiastaticus TaxID=3154512 RepID=UPI00342702C1
MIVSASAALLFAIAMFALLRARYVGPGAATVVFLCGFFTAGTGASGPIQSVVQAFVRALSSLA